MHMPLCLPACTSYPAGHRLWLAVFNRGCVFVVTVFLLSNFSGFAALRTTAFASERRVAPAPHFLLFMHTKGKCMYTFYIMRFFKKTHISVYEGSLKGLCKMIELILGKKLEPNHLQKTLERTNVSRLGLQYIKKNRNEILLIYTE